MIFEYRRDFGLDELRELIRRRADHLDALLQKLRPDFRAASTPH
jgi:hypothetical protein